MPPKTPEATRNRVLEMLKQKPPASYTAIQKETRLTRPVIWKIKKEAGLIGSARPSSPANPSGSTAPNAASPSPTPTGSVGSVQAATGDGLSEFQPKALRVAKKPESKEEGASRAKQYMRCTSCGEVFTFEDVNEIPETCPECGK